MRILKRAWNWCRGRGQEESAPPTAVPIESREEAGEVQPLVAEGVELGTYGTPVPNEPSSTGVTQTSEQSSYACRFYESLRTVVSISVGAASWQLSADACATALFAGSWPAYLGGCALVGVADATGSTVTNVVFDLGKCLYFRKNKLQHPKEYLKGFVSSFVTASIWQPLTDLGSLIGRAAELNAQRYWSDEIAAEIGKGVTIGASCITVGAGHGIALAVTQKIAKPKSEVPVPTSALGDVGFYVEGPTPLGDFSPANVRNAVPAALFAGGFAAATEFGIFAAKQCRRSRCVSSPPSEAVEDGSSPSGQLAV